MKCILKSLLLSFCILAINIHAKASTIGDTTTLEDAIKALQTETSKIINDSKYKDVSDADKQELQKQIDTAIKEAQKNVKSEQASDDAASGDEETKGPTSTTTTSSNTMTEEQKAEIAEKEAKVQELKEKEQSLENRMTTAVSMGGAGIGGMMLAESLSEQRVDEQSEQDMAAYIETFRCTYAGGKSVKGGATEVQLPADTLFDLYQEYIALAADVKTMKEQLDLMPGIESEVIIDKATAGLYDDQSSGKINGTYASLYRTLTDESSEDAQQWADQKAETDKNKKIGIGVGVGAAALGGIGNILTNHVDWDKIKEEKDSEKTQKEALEKLQECLEDGGAKHTKKLKFSNFPPSALKLDNIDCDSQEWETAINKREAKDLFTDTTDIAKFTQKLKQSFGEQIANKLLGIGSGNIE